MYISVRRRHLSVRCVRPSSSSFSVHPFRPSHPFVVVGLCTGIVCVRGLTVTNPPELGYQSEYMTKADRIFVNVSMRQLIRSCGRKLILQQVIIDSVHGIVETVDGQHSATSLAQGAYMSQRISASRGLLNSAPWTLIGRTAVSAQRSKSSGRLRSS